MVDENVIKAVRTYLRAVVQEGIPVSFGVVFGSQAAGRADQWSDIDLVVVSPRFDRVRLREDTSLLWRVAARTDSRIEPIGVGAREWEEDDVNPILEIARRGGAMVLPDESG